MHRHMVRLLVTLAALAALTASPSAFAQRELLSKLGAKSTLAIDQISGFRAGSVASQYGADGFSYAGIVGFSYQSYSASPFTNAGVNLNGDTTIHATTIWVAPSADFFVIDGLSVGGLISIASTSGSVTTPINNNGATQTVTLPGTTNFSVIPRVGYLIPISERFGIWPRGGFGYSSRQIASFTNGGNNAVTNRQTAAGFLLDLDVGFIYRPHETIYFRLGPEATFTLGASHSETDNNNVTRSAPMSTFQLAVLGGVGAFIDL